MMARVAQLQKKNYERLQKALDSVMSIREMTQVQEVEEGRWGMVNLKGVAPFFSLPVLLWDSRLLRCYSQS